MIVLPDGIKIEMQWKQVTYMRGKDYVTFEIVPMLKEKDIIIIPNETKWLTGQR